MSTNLRTNLYTKHPLRFREDHSFTVLMLSDIQETLDYDKRTLTGLEQILDTTKPDLVFLGGDNCNGLILKTQEELKQYLDIFSNPMEKRNILWAHVFGNHDHDMPVSDIEMQAIYESYPHCISKHTDSSIYGTTNFVLPVKYSDTEQIAFNIWGLDSNNTIQPNWRNTLPNRPSMSGEWDFIHFSQLQWYWNGSLELEQYNKSTINGMLITHMSLWEFNDTLLNPEETNLQGRHDENIVIGSLNSGLFATILQRGDINCIACGHSHLDDFQSEHLGIKLCLDGSAGYSPYGDNNYRGGRIFKLNENKPNTIKTHMIYYKDL